MKLLFSLDVKKRFLGFLKSIKNFAPSNDHLTGPILLIE